MAYFGIDIRIVSVQNSGMTKFTAYIKTFVRPEKTVKKSVFDTLLESDRRCDVTKFRGKIDRRYVQLLPPEPNPKIREIEKKLKNIKSNMKCSRNLMITTRRQS